MSLAQSITINTVTAIFRITKPTKRNLIYSLTMTKKFAEFVNVAVGCAQALNIRSGF